ncbi:MAG: 4Fe-4S dicluster domain-containing protein [Bacillota bacterium]|nr:4Fe-4S dicluster domain-containing protein [Bacillota bacterium]
MAAQEVAMLTDVSQCIGCKACEVACKEWNQLPAEKTSFQGSYQSHPDLTAHTWTVVRFTEQVKADGQVRWHFNKMSCMHCTEAACVLACPVEALRHDPSGAIRLETDRCIGCGYCEEACPFGAVHVDRQSFDTAKVAGKCTFCFDRISNGLEPACVHACPTDAIRFGPREELVGYGRQRVDELRKGGHAQANLYGEKELGGLHYMFVLTEKPEVYGLPADPQVSPTQSFWKGILQPAGRVILGAGVVGALAHLVVASRSFGQREATEKAGQREKGGDGRHGPDSQV